MDRIDGPYALEEETQRWYKQSKDEGYQLLTNFTAQITHEHVYHDGPRTNTVLTLAGTMIDKDGATVELKPVTIDATELKSMSWVPQKWGMRPLLYPVPGCERDVSTILQIVSQPVKTDIYTHTGWARIGTQHGYLTMTGALLEKTFRRDIAVQLPAELTHYALPDPTETTKQDVHASLSLLKIGPPTVLWPSYLATFRASLGPADFALFIAGRTGTFKSELASLMQSHYGTAMNARKLPASWNSTGNALQALSYRSKDALIVIDDYVPIGTGYQLRGLAAKVDEVIRAQGNQAGRTRLTDTSSIQGTMYPRGIILGTGEDVPEGHSIRGRMLVSELAPGDIPIKLLTNAQANRPSYAKALADWIRYAIEQQLPDKIKGAADIYRDTVLGIGHSRTPSILGDLMATAEYVAQWCQERKWLSPKNAADFATRAHEALKQAGQNQKQYLTTADPIEIFTATIRQILATQKAHLRTRNGGVPEHADLYGYIITQGHGEAVNYKACGPCIGWLDAEKSEFLLDPNALAYIKKQSDGHLAVTDQTFAKRLKDAQLLIRTDAARQRNTVRQTIDGHPRNVLAMNMHDVLAEPA